MNHGMLHHLVIGAVIIISLESACSVSQPTITPSPTSTPTSVKPTSTASSPLSNIPTGHIAFVSDTTGKKQIYVINADGTDLRRLTDDRANDYNPAWSPDGRSIVFESDQGGQHSIYLMNSDGTNRRPLSTKDDLSEYHDPAWSPDGRYIAFSYMPTEGVCYIYCEVRLVMADGSEYSFPPSPTANYKMGKTNPTWSPDSQSLAFDWNIPITFGGGIYVTNIWSTSLREVVVGDVALWPAWSPDGHYIAFNEFNSGYTLALVNADGTNKRSTAMHISSKPTWSPDSRFIAFYSDKGIVVVNVDLTELHKVTDGSCCPAWSPR